MNFSNIIGHYRNIELLKKMITGSRFPHGLLFVGAAGVGKRLVSVAAAAFLNCGNPDKNGACGHCSSCIKLRAGTHPLVKFVGSPRNESELSADFIEGPPVTISNIVPSDERDNKKKTIRINIYQIREVRKEANLKPYISGKKIFIIDDAAEAGREALNCLLKVLEEPPTETYFILITSKEDLLLPTVKSRCQILKFSSLSDKEMKEFIDKKLSEKINKERVTELIDISSGSPGKFLRFLKLEDIMPAQMEPEIFFSRISKWFSNNLECKEKLHILLEQEGAGFRRTPVKEIYKRIEVIENTLESIKKNANPELAVSNMFLKLGLMS